jgi:topoisomerase-4 subunit A
MGADDQRVLLASDAGYGFVAKLEDLASKNKAGKAMLTLPENAKVLPPQFISNPEQALLAAVSNDGRLLVFPVTELPELAKGKGNKIMNIPSARAQTHEEYVLAVKVLNPNQLLTLYSGKRHITLKMSDLEHYKGERGRRGNKLPRGFQKVDMVEVTDK